MALALALYEIRSRFVLPASSNAREKPGSSATEASCLRNACPADSCQSNMKTLNINRALALASFSASRSTTMKIFTLMANLAKRRLSSCAQTWKI